MTPSRYGVRHVKRFALTFLLVAGAVGAASYLDSATTSTSTQRSSPSTTPAGVPHALPTLDLNEFCGRDALPGKVNAESKFVCIAPDGNVNSHTVDSACVVIYGVSSRRVIIASDTDALRCVPEDRIDLGAPDFAEYCIALYGSTAVASWVANDNEGWRCSALRSGIFQTIMIDYKRHEVDRICQVAFGVEAFAEETGSGLDGWRCFGSA